MTVSHDWEAIDLYNNNNMLPVGQVFFETHSELFYVCGFFICPPLFFLAITFLLILSDLYPPPPPTAHHPTFRCFVAFMWYLNMLHAH